LKFLNETADAKAMMFIGIVQAVEWRNTRRLAIREVIDP